MVSQLAADLNNQGAACLQAGQLKESLLFFKNALNLTYSELETPVLSGMTDTSTGKRFPALSQSNSESIQSRAAASLLTSAPTAEYDCNDFSNFSAASVPFVYSHALHIVASSTAYSRDPLVNTSIVSGIILFNIGVVYHLRGLDGSTDSSSCLMKACTLYNKTLVVLSDAGVPFVSMGQPVIDLLTMALQNNLAQASHEMTIFEHSGWYFEQLVTYAVTVFPCHYEDATVASFVDQQKSNFLLNAIILRAPKLAAAA